MKLSDYVMDFVAELGVRHIFFLPGGAAMHLNDSLARHPDLEPVCNLHEQACAIAAEAYAKFSSGFGVAMVTAGPGGTNAITGTASAWLDSIPCIFLSGQVKSPDLKGGSALRQLGVQEVDIVGIVGPITKYAVTITDPSTIRYHLERGLHEATTGRRGPVWFDIPLDVQAAEIVPENLPGFASPAIAGPASCLDEAAAKFIAMLNESERPVIAAGNGIRLAGAADLFLPFVELLGVPVVATWLGFDLIPSDHPLCLGRPGAIAPRYANYCLQNSDLLLAVGARLDMAMTGYSHANLAREARKIIVDIDAAEIGKFSTNIELPIVGDAREFIEAVIRQKNLIRKRDRSPWLGACNDWKQRYPLMAELPAASGTEVSMYRFASALSGQLEPGEVVASGSSGFACEIFLLVVESKPGQRISHSRGLGAMGFGLPASIGACFASGKRRTICVDGDGGFQMNIQELATIAEHNLPIKLFVVNNRGYSSIRSSQSNYFKLCVGCDENSGLRLPDIKAVARAYGLPAYCIDNPENLEVTIREVLNSPGPALCEVVVMPDEARVPRLASSQRADGSMVSRPLEDLFPFLDREEFHRNMLVAPVGE